MVLSEILKLALDSFRASKVRFMLTALGMVIGTASVILVVTIGLTGKQFILNEIQKIGTNEVEVEYAGGGASGSGRVLYNDSLTRDDEKAVLAQVPSVLYSSPILEMHERISFGGGMVKDTLVMGVSPEYRNVRNLMVLSGRFFDEEDEDAHIKCAVVTVPFAIQMFGSSDEAIGRDFQILGIPFRIVGTFKESVDTFGQSEITDNTILIPYSVARYFTGTDSVKPLYFSIRSMNEVPDATKEIMRVISSRHKPNSVYKAQNLKELLDHRRHHRQRADRSAGAGGGGHAGGGRRGHHEHHAGHGARRASARSASARRWGPPIGRSSSSSWRRRSSFRWPAAWWGCLWVSRCRCPSGSLPTWRCPSPACPCSSRWLRPPLSESSSEPCRPRAPRRWIRSSRSSMSKRKWIGVATRRSTRTRRRADPTSP